MKSDKMVAIFFEEISKNGQERIIETELMSNFDCCDLKLLDYTVNTEIYGYDTIPENQELLQDIHATIDREGVVSHWLMVWDCMECEFQTLKEE